MYLLELLHRSKKTIQWMSIIFVLSLNAYPQGRTGGMGDTNDIRQIPRLIKGLCDHSLSPDAVLDPRINQQKRVKNLRYFDDPSYQITLIPAGELQIDKNGFASEPVRVFFQNENHKFEGRSEIQFVKRDGAWYFANFDFLEFSTGMIFAIIITVLISVAWATGVFFVRSRLIKKEQLHGANWIKTFIPFFWPGLCK